MSERSKLIDRLIAEKDFRADYIRAKLDVLVPSQLRALRLNKEMNQPALANEAGMKQSRISAMETPGKVNFNLETLVRMAAAFGVGLVVKFVPFSEMLRWENEYSQDSFDVASIDEDIDFLDPSSVTRSYNQIDETDVIKNRAATKGADAIGNRAVTKEEDQHQLASGGIEYGTRAAA